MVLNVHAPSEEKSYNLKDSFYEELEQVDNSSFESVEEFKYLGRALTFNIIFRKKLRAD
jgi:hypothetical protein